MSHIEINKVYLEDDLSVFKIITGNRSVEPIRVKKIKASINAVGMIDAPIVCNENMEVIDGQGRLQACKDLGKPISYIVIKGLSIEHCRAMNLNQTNWQLTDYIRSYADEGNVNYVRLCEFLKDSNFKIGIALDIVYKSSAGNHDKELKTGNFVFSEVNKAEAVTLATWLHQFDGIKTNRQRDFYRSLSFCYRLQEVNKGTLVRKVLSDPKAFESIATEYECLGIIEDVYNKRTSSDTLVYIQHLFDVWLDSRGVRSVLEAQRKAREEAK